jgi:hypothetical protein
MKRVLFVCLLFCLTAAAQPNPKDQALLKPHLPKGYQLVSSLRLPLQGKSDLVAIAQKDDSTRVFVLPTGAKAPLWLTLKDKKSDFMAPVQGGSGEKLSDLIYSCDLDHNGKPYLFVTCYLADVYQLTVFKPSPKGYSEIFRDQTNGNFQVNHKTGRIHREATEADPARTYNWVKGRYQSGK